jgi:sugar lactone lactonase YvrE
MQKAPRTASIHSASLESFVSLLVGLVLAVSAVAEVPIPYNSEKDASQPLPPAEAAAQWKLPPGFSMSVFAAEPDVRQPIAIAMDGRGRLWVAECYTYAEAKKGFDADLRDRILIFEDVDGDGHFDRRTVFAENLERLSSIEIGFGGVWALTSPTLVFIPDRDGDDRPDGPAEVKLDGFEWQRNHHTIANGLRWGPDGWLYGRHGIQAVSAIGKPGTPDELRAKTNGGIWRYHPQRGSVEIVCHGTTNPWGMDWNEYGEGFFINTVIGHLWHVIPGAHYRRMHGNDLNPKHVRIDRSARRSFTLGGGRAVERLAQDRHHRCHVSSRRRSRAHRPDVLRRRQLARRVAWQTAHHQLQWAAAECGGRQALTWSGATAPGTSASVSRISASRPTRGSAAST